MSDLFSKLQPNKGYVIAEIACGHEGDIIKFKRLIDCIAESGAQIIKFQIFTPLERATVDHSEWEIFNDLSLSKQEWHQAFDYARQYNLTIFADIFGEASFSIAKELAVELLLIS